VHRHIWPVVTAIFVFLAGLASVGQQSQAPAADFDLQAARGNITRVSCLQDPAQSYAIYLPSHYTPDRPWPVIYAFDPFARGKTAVEEYKDAAEKYGYIVAGSNNSRNGPVADELGAAQAMWLDTHRRFAIDKNRIYTTGLSGGARAATAFALYCYSCNVAGVIAHGAGYPTIQNVKQAANDHFVYYAAIGDLDFNYPEIMALRKKKEEAGAPFKIKIYPGPHQWAPPEIVEDAVEWLELKAMQAGAEKVDPTFVHQQFEKTQAEATQAEQRGDALAQYYALRSLVGDFKDLEDTASFAAKLAEVKKSKAFRNAEHAEQRQIDDQKALTATHADELARLGNADVNAQSGMGRQIVTAMLDLQRRANSTSNDHAVYARAFNQLWIQGLEVGQDALREGRTSQAIAYFEVMAEASPDQAWPMLLLAEARTRAGDKKAALKAIELAVQRGLKRAEALTQDPELQPLASDPEFQRIVQGLSAQ
jgi:dienelactone hydrolase